MKRLSKMFDLVTETWNPVGGRCPHGCIYCWSMGEKGLVLRHKMKKYEGEIRLIEKEFKREFKPGSFVFVQDMSDLFADAVNDLFIQRILSHIRKFPDSTFLLLTKNPGRYRDFRSQIKDNCICGTTAESNRSHNVTKAPHPTLRLIHLSTFRFPRKMVAIEPIMDFDLERFVFWIREVEPEFVYVGYDNYKHGLPEPLLAKTKRLIRKMKQFTKVRLKTLRDPL